MLSKPNLTADLGKKTSSVGANIHIRTTNLLRPTYEFLGRRKCEKCRCSGDQNIGPRLFSGTLSPDSGTWFIHFIIVFFIYVKHYEDIAIPSFFHHCIVNIKLSQVISNNLVIIIPPRVSIVLKPMPAGTSPTGLPDSGRSVPEDDHRLVLVSGLISLSL